ncbi:MAG TPA: iron ABC transporter permease [Candidatus Stackebrandtia faecavium]|nr:iron ABC transporter permease [Candidatus Stackebrandtia faecavium]
MRRATPRIVPIAATCAVGLLIILFGSSMLVGSGDVPIAESWRYALGDAQARADAHLTMVMIDLRLPRTVVAIIAGACLGIAGCLLQSATRNPLAETGLLGVNAGAALCVVIGITILSIETAPAILAFAFFGALAASALIMLIAGSAQQLSPLRLVLAGVALSATFRGATSYILMSQPATYDRYRMWVLGSLSGVQFTQLVWVLPTVIAGIVIAALLTRPLGALSLGDDIASALGHNPRLVRIGAAASVTLLTGATVSMCGPIAFLGLLAPYLARAIGGPKLGGQLLLSGLGGAAIMVAADIAARVVLAPYEAPVSVLLAVIGGPLLILIVRTGRVLTLRAPGGAS